MRRALLVLSALAVSALSLTVGIATDAGAAHVHYNTITCTTVSGNVASTVTVSGCTGGNTGGSSQPIPATALATGGTITWVSGSTTTLATPTITAVSAKHCPTAGSSADSIKATVTADTGDTLKIPGVATGEACIAPSGAITALKNFKLT